MHMVDQDHELERTLDMSKHLSRSRFHRPVTAGNPFLPCAGLEKPLTRLMLGRSWWDLNIKVDVEKVLTTV